MNIIKINHIVFFLFLFVNSFFLNAQERGLLLSKYYAPKDYKASSQNWSIIEDKRGVLYFGNTICILEYDGNEWRKIYTPNNSGVRALDIDSNNNIYAGAYNELGILMPDQTGNLNFHSLKHLIDSSYYDFADVWKTHCIGEDVYFLTRNYLFRYKNQKFNVWKKTGSMFYSSFYVNNELFVHEFGKGLLKLENDSLILIKKGDFFSDKKIQSIIPFKNKIIIGTRKNGLYLYDNSNDQVDIKSFTDISTSASKLNNYLIKNSFYNGIKITDNLLALSSITGDVVLVNSNWEVVEVISHESTGITSETYSFYYQKGQSLWLGMANGICQVDILSPFRYWNDEKGISGNLADVATLDNILYVSTGSGLYCTPRKRDNINFTINNFKPVKGDFEQTWGFAYFILPNSDYNDTKNIIYGQESNLLPTSDKILLLLASGTGLYQITDKESSKKIANYKSFRIYQYQKDPSNIFIGTMNGVARLSYSDGKWTDHGIQYNITDEIRDMGEDSVGNLWISALYKGVYCIQNPLLNENHNIENYYTYHGLPSTLYFQFSKIDNKLFLIGPDNYFIFENKSNSFVEFKHPIFCKDSGNYSPHDTLPWKKIDEHILTGSYITTCSDSSQWFGTTEGVIFRYIFSNKKDFFNLPSVIIRKVAVDDSIIYNGTNFKELRNSFDTNATRYIISTNPIIDKETILKFKNNSLSFTYTLPFYEDEARNEYSYFLEGYDKSWSIWNTETKKEYTNLPEGDYIFKVKSRNLYQIESQISEYKFKILPPWYRSIVAFIAYILFGIIFIIIIVRLYTYRLIKEKDKLEKIVIERTQEILMQKEEILVQAEHLKDANEFITAKNEELEKQKWEITNQAVKLKKANIELIKLSKVASETDNAIGIFDKFGDIEWVNEGFTRMYGYTLSQYKKEKNINLLNSSDNPNIQEAVKQCLNEKKSVVYQFKTKTRDGKELWAQTTLTNVIDRYGETINLIAIDSDITKIKLAEKEILKQKQEIEEQRDKLAISNATKNKFFRIIAHDLRSPISTLAGSTNLIFNDFDEYDKEQTKMFIGELNKLSQTTFNLLENLLDWSTTQMGEIKFLPKIIDLYSLTDENIELIKGKVDSKNINLISNIEPGCNAYADENMVKTVIRNLLSNAVKFTPKKGTIEISCKVFEDSLKYTVKDSGIGISDEDQKKLFRIDTHHTTLGLSNEKGSGLGLILCKEFIEKNGGVINISSQPNQGTTIDFTLKKRPF